MPIRSTRIRQQVASQYTDLVEDESSRPFADPETNPSYSEDDLAALPKDAEGASFGCGNPFAFAEVQRGHTVIDLGSGAGLDLLLARERTGSEGKVIGIDMTDAMIEKARHNIERAGFNNVEVRKGIIEELPIATSSVDWVISNCVVNLSPNKSAVFAEIARVLKPGGRMLISDIVINDVKPWMRAAVRPFNESVAGAISERDYIAGLQAAGLDDVAVLNRLVYDEPALKRMIGSELAAAGTSFKRARAWLAGWLVDPLVEAATGRVVSVKIAARRAGE